MRRQIIERLVELLSRLTQVQKASLAAATVATLVGIFYLLVWANRPEFSLLYSKLEAGEASQIVEDLKGNDIPYQLKDGGESILVPKKHIYELRIKYAAQNLITTGAIGYELFDRNNLGLTDFMQRITLKRALEGELSNTINQIEAILQSRIHLVMPEQTLFEDEQRKTTASVVIKLRPQESLERKQIVGISYLVSASVEGLEPENVIIVDTFGRVLTKNNNQDDEVSLSSSQYELQQNLEKYLSRKAQSMLDKVLGLNNSIVRVSASLNFDKVSRVVETVDPENTAVLSEEHNEETSTTRDTTLFQRENTITNYELNKTREVFTSSVGDIKQLFISVFVNTPDTTGGRPVTPRTQEELDDISALVQNAIGFDATRNDQIVVQELAFDRSVFDRELQVLTSIEEQEKINHYVKVGMIAAGALFLLVMMRSVIKKTGLDEYLRRQREALLEEAKTSIDSLIGEKEISEEEITERIAQESKAKQEAQEKIKKEVREFTQADTPRAGRILRYWLMDED